MARYQVSDGDYKITQGLVGISSVTVIQKPDASGGYNVSYSLTGSLALYHIHYNRSGTRVKAIRYKSGSGAEGDNIIYADGETFTDMMYECTNKGKVIYKNTHALLKLLKEANAAAPKDERNEIK